MIFLLSCAFVSSLDMDKRLDPDGDGITITDDCDDALASVGERIAWYKDLDGDGYGNPDLPEYFCGDPGEDWSINDLDCDDESSSIHPLALEICDEIDNNCNGEIDEGQGDEIDGSTYFLDADGDGVGTSDVILESCFPPEGYVETSGDCDDQNSSVYVGAAYLEDDLSLCMSDMDGDGYGDVQAPIGGASGTDCNDTDEQIHPFALEIVADGVDQDCNTLDMCFLDADGDGFGSTETVLGTQIVSSDSSAPSSFFCLSEGVASNQDDCDDTDMYTFSGAAWLDSSTLCMTDFDQDGFGDTNPPQGGSAGSDCDDTNMLFHPSAIDVIADGIDQNCDGVDECYFDGDGDGFGMLSSYSDIMGSSASTLNCSGTNESTLSTDCDDTDISVSPVGVELPGDGIDQDCNGVELCYFDGDQDGYSAGEVIHSSNIGCSGTNETNSLSMLDCDDDDVFAWPGAAYHESSTDCMRDYDGDGYGEVILLGLVLSGSDCDDSNPAIYPSATEVCDEIDNDCDGLIDDNDNDLDTTSAISFYEDADEDGYGNAAFSVSKCSMPTGFSENADDCDDMDQEIHPGAIEETADGIDQDCDGAERCFLDDDGDTYPSILTSLSTDLTCTSSGFSPGGAQEDCDDSDAAIHPMAEESAGSVDYNCDGFEVIDNTCYSSHDGSTYFLYCATEVDWPQARQNCEDMGYQLTSIRSEDENTHIVDYLTEDLWIGYRDIDDTSCMIFGTADRIDFRWTDEYEGYYRTKSSFGCTQIASNGFHNWDAGGGNGGQPDNWQSSEDCVEIYGEIGPWNLSVGTWNDRPCEHQNGYICSIRE